MNPIPFSLLIKPAGADCNLRCHYCFYREKTALYPEASAPRMTSAVLAKVIERFLDIPQAVHAFCWQGGEPTLLGLPFFEQVTRLQSTCAAPGSVIANSLQTNATLVDDALAAHLADYRFLVGCSLDGPAGIHDRHRRGPGGHDSHAATLRGLENLWRRGVAVNVLTLVSEANVGRAPELYRYFRSLGIDQVQFIPCVQTGAPDGAATTISGEAWGGFLCDLFDQWWPGDVGRVSIRLFDAVVAKLAYGVELICTQASDCRGYLVIEHNGDVYPCDFYVEADRRLGNIADDSLGGLRESDAYRRFGAAKLAVPPQCAACPYWDLCQGDCPRNRPVGRPSRLCAGWRRFYEHALPRLRELARLRRERDGFGDAGGFGGT